MEKSIRSRVDNNSDARATAKPTIVPALCHEPPRLSSECKSPISAALEKILA